MYNCSLNVLAVELYYYFLCFGLYISSVECLKSKKSQHFERSAPKRVLHPFSA
jgi:hypothetical protein